MSTNNQNNGRLHFVQPNNLYDEINGVPLTPQYEDLSIYVNLFVEVVNRTKPQSGGMSGSDGDIYNSNNFLITWSSYYDEIIGENSNKPNTINEISFIEGDDYNSYVAATENKYLTTYYTDISLDEIRKRNIVEGLGISNIDIAYDNMYMPTITIKFIDMRGASVFGREDVSHKNNQITMENIFGCFFTLPYPKFKLQIKGFYGDAVTYQLACTGFKARFNSQTGNFEITSTFIGYQYSLLSDIPFTHIMAAPYCEYVGIDYWDKNIGTEEWKLSEGAQMVKLFDIYVTLKNELKNGSSQTSEKLSTISNVQSSLNRIETQWKNIKTMLTKHYCGDNSTNGENTEKTAFFGGDATSEEDDKVYYIGLTNDANLEAFTEEILNEINTLMGILILFNENYGSDYDSFATPEIKKPDPNKVIANVKDNENTVQCIKNFISRKGDGWLTSSTYGYVYEDYGIEKKIKKIQNLITEKNNEIVTTQENEIISDDDFVSKLSFKPTIGNFFKIIMAHLETFTAMMYTCANNIIESVVKNDRTRTPQNLNINISNTDVTPSLQNVPPFPAVYKMENDVNTESTDNTDNFSKQYRSLGWVGDFSHNFEEEDLVVKIQKSIERINDEHFNKDVLNIIDYSKVFPSTPFDFFHKQDFSVVNKSGNDMFTRLAIWLGLRMTQTFGIFNNDVNISEDLIKAHAKMDAITYFNALPQTFRSSICEQFLNKDTNNTLSFNDTDVKNVLEKLTQRGETDSTTPDFFEYYNYNSKGSNVRQYHVFLEPQAGNIKDSEYFYYTYCFIDGYNVIVPKDVRGSENYMDGLISQNKTMNFYNGLTIPLHNVNINKLSNHYTNLNNFLYDTDILEYQIKDDNSKKEFINYYLNESLFNIIINKGQIRGIENRYNTLKSGSTTVNGVQISGLKPIFEKYYDFQITKDMFYTTEKTEWFYFLTKKTTGMKIDGFETKLDTSLTQYEFFEEWISKYLVDAKQNEECFSQHDYNDYYLEELLISIDSSQTQTTTTISTTLSLPFMCDYKNTHNKTDSEFQIFIQKLKLLWIIQRMYFNWNKVFNKITQSNTYIKKIPLALALYIGGFFWYYRELFELGKYKYENENEFLIFNNNNDFCNYCGVRLNDKGFFIKNDKQLYRARIFLYKERSDNLKELYGGDSDPYVNPLKDYEPNIYVKNKYIQLFEEWFDNKGNELVNLLTHKTNTLILAILIKMFKPITKDKPLKKDNINQYLKKFLDLTDDNLTFEKIKEIIDTYNNNTEDKKQHIDTDMFLFINDGNVKRIKDDINKLAEISIENVKKIYNTYFPCIKDLYHYILFTDEEDDDGSTLRCMFKSDKSTEKTSKIYRVQTILRELHTQDCLIYCGDA